MARMFWIGSLSLLAILGAVAAGYSWMKGPMYRPGDLRSGKFKAAAPPVQNGATNRWTMEPGIELYHFEEGSGTPLLIVHGGPGFPPEKPWQGGSLLARHYRTIYYHQRGCGNSSRPISRFSTPNMYANMKLLNEQLGLPAQIADIERIRQILGQQKLVLVGHSYPRKTTIAFLKENKMSAITKEQLRADLVRIIGVLTNLKPADVKDGQRLREDLGLDSLQSMELLFRISDKFMLDLKMEDVMDLQTVGQVVSRLFLFIQDGGKKLA